MSSGAIRDFVRMLEVSPNMEMRRRVFSSGESPELSSWLEKIQRFKHILGHDEDNYNFDKLMLLLIIIIMTILIKMMMTAIILITITM